MKKTAIGFALLWTLLQLGSARADEFPVQGAPAMGRPGDRVFLELVYDYGSSFKVIVEDFQFDYPSPVLAFVPDASTLTLLGTQRSLPEYVAMLRTFAANAGGVAMENRNPTLGPAGRKGYALSFFTDGSVGHDRGGQARLRAAFDVLPGAIPGAYMVSFGTSGLVDDLGNEFIYPESLQSLSVTVLAVPEPSIALMLLPALGLVVVVVRRRSKRAEAA